MPPQTTRSFMKEFRNSFRRKKVLDPAHKVKSEEDAVKVKLRELKESMGEMLPSMHCDEDLIGFLKARSMDVKEAEKLVKLDESVRRILRVEEYHPRPELHTYNFSGVIGFTKGGRLARVVNVGDCDANGIIHTISTIEISKILIMMANHDMALQEEENRKSGRSIRDFFHILNVENLTMQQVSCKPAIDTVVQAVKLVQDHYHDLLAAIYIVNAPPFFSSVFKIFKPVIQDCLQEKIKIFDSGSSKDELLKIIDADVLPKYLGGNRVDSNGDPNCSEIIPTGFIIPESSYVSNFLDPNDPDVVSITIPAGEKFNYKIPIHEIGSVVKWHIQSKDYDLAICVFHQPFQSDGQSHENKEDEMEGFEPLTPTLRCQCHVCPEVDSTVLWFTGILLLQFDNSYSWMNPKEVMFKITIEPPNGTECSLRNATNLMREVSLSL